MPVNAGAYCLPTFIEWKKKELGIKENFGGIFTLQESKAAPRKIS
jgi:hypothetical protein